MLIYFSINCLNKLVNKVRIEKKDTFFIRFETYLNYLHKDIFQDFANGFKNRKIKAKRF